MIKRKPHNEIYLYFIKYKLVMFFSAEFPYQFFSRIYRFVLVLCFLTDDPGILVLLIVISSNSFGFTLLGAKNICLKWQYLFIL